MNYKFESPLSEAYSNYEERILDLTEQLYNEEFMKNNYENALKHLRDRLIQIELKDSEAQMVQCVHKEEFVRREKKLIDRIDELQRSNRILTTQSKNEANKAKVLQLEREVTALHMRLDNNVDYYKQQAENYSSLESEIQTLKTKLDQQVKFNQELKSKISVENLQGRLEKTNKKIVELKNTLVKYTKAPGSSSKIKKKKFYRNCCTPIRHTHEKYSCHTPIRKRRKHNK